VTVNGDSTSVVVGALTLTPPSAVHEPQLSSFPVDEASPPSVELVPPSPVLSLDESEPLVSPASPAHADRGPTMPTNTNAPHIQRMH
jgi:hypothetical protein